MHPRTPPALQSVGASGPASAAATAQAYRNIAARLIETFNRELRTPLTTLVCHASC
jgi:hypothetical protein